MVQPDYVIIVGQGRSGTNWLLDLLDFSPVTYCRNEVNELDPEFEQLPSPAVVTSLPNTFGGEWDRLIASASLRMGTRDRVGNKPKDYLYEPVRKLGCAAILNKQKLRQVFAPVIPELREDDWLTPLWLFDRQALKEALVVLKLNQIPNWAVWVLQNRPKIMVLHIVRHPGGFLNSWRGRYLKENEITAVEEANKRRLLEVAKSDSQWAFLAENINSMSVEESELWYWRYANETIYRVGKGKSNYFCVVYEDLATNTLEIAKDIYFQCKLPWQETVESQIKSTTSASKEIATSWQKKLLDQQVAIVNDILIGSCMENWWS